MFTPEACLRLGVNPGQWYEIYKITDYSVLIIDPNAHYPIRIDHEVYNRDILVKDTGYPEETEFYNKVQRKSDGIPYTARESSDAKETNPKAAVGVLKVPFSTLSMPVMAEVAVGMLEGSIKYGRHNYRASGAKASVYYDAALRHLGQWFEGEDIDPDSGLNHVTKAISSLVVLRDVMLLGKLNDDRPIKANQGFMRDLEQDVKKLVSKYPEAKSPYTERDNMTSYNGDDVECYINGHRVYIDKNGGLDG